MLTRILMLSPFVYHVYILGVTQVFTSSEMFVKENFVPDLRQFSEISCDFLDLLTCARLCLRNKGCYSLLYEEDSRRFRGLKGLPRRPTDVATISGTLYVNKGKICNVAGFTYSTVLDACYLIDYSELDYDMTKQFCKARHAELIRINTPMKQRFVEQVMNNVPGVRFNYIDGQRDDEGVWRFGDGTPISTLYWAPDEPDNWTVSRCVMTNPGRGNQWIDKSCDKTKYTSRICVRDVYQTHDVDIV